MECPLKYIEASRTLSCVSCLYVPSAIMMMDNTKRLIISEIMF